MTILPKKDTDESWFFSLNIHPKYFSVSDPYQPVIIIYEKKTSQHLPHLETYVLHVRYITRRLLQQLCLSLRFLPENSSKLHFILSLLLYFFTVYD